MPAKTFKTTCNLVLILITVASILLSVWLQHRTRIWIADYRRIRAVRDSLSEEILELEQKIEELEERLAGKRQPEREE